jgi:hypothetical protein
MLHFRALKENGAAGCGSDCVACPAIVENWPAAKKFPVAGGAEALALCHKRWPNPRP